MGKNVIVSEDTLRDLLEAHASLSAWYYELWLALRRANASCNAPDDAARAAFVERMAVDFPEIASVARAIRIPRLFVPPPPIIAVPPKAAEGTAESGSSLAGAQPAEPRMSAGTGAQPAEPRMSAATAVEPAPARAGQQQASEPGIAPPPMVIPSEVKYE